MKHMIFLPQIALAAAKKRHGSVGAKRGPFPAPMNGIFGNQFQFFFFKGFSKSRRRGGRAAGLGLVWVFFLRDVFDVICFKMWKGKGVKKGPFMQLFSACECVCHQITLDPEANTDWIMQ